MNKIDDRTVRPNAEAAADRRQPTAVLFCYHYDPSSAVASRRVRAMAHVLASMGLAVEVVSAFGGAPVEYGENLGPGIFAHPVFEPSSLLLSKLVWIKRLLTRGTAMPIGEPAVAPAAEEPGVDVSPRGIVQRIRDAYFALLYIIDTQKKWAIRAASSALRSTRNRDVRVVVTSGPPFSGVVAAWFVARRLRAPLITDFRDPFLTASDGVINIPRPARVMLRSIEREVVAYSAAVTAAAPGMTLALQQRYPSRASLIHLMMNGYDEGPSTEIAFTGYRLCVLFAGILYPNRDPFPFLRAVETLLAKPNVDHSRIAIKFVGECDQYCGVSLAAWLRGKRAAHVVELLPKRTRKELQPLIDKATVMLTLAQGQRPLIPAMAFEHLASGREVLAICEPDSDTGRLLATVRGVTQVAPDHQTAIESALESLYQRHAIDGTLTLPAREDVRRFSRQNSNDIFKRILGAVMRRQDQRPGETT